MLFAKSSWKKSLNVVLFLSFHFNDYKAGKKVCVLWEQGIREVCFKSMTVDIRVDNVLVYQYSVSA